MKKIIVLIGSLVMTSLPAMANEEAVRACHTGGPGERLEACTDIINNRDSFNNDQVQAAFAERGVVNCQTGKQDTAFDDFKRSANAMQHTMKLGYLSNRGLYNGPIDGQLNDEYMNAIDQFIRSGCQ
ncbi:MAG: hypothetical protein COA52_10410 [Hyphomicrobiales bacterium]|nr:MAG: hypothetical protein COA52_10410 [Hyphomicrobiales bacterium]